MIGWEIEGNLWFWLWLLTFVTACLIMGAAMLQTFRPSGRKMTKDDALIFSPLLVALSPFIFIALGVKSLFKSRPKDD